MCNLGQIASLALIIISSTLSPSKSLSGLETGNTKTYMHPRGRGEKVGNRKEKEENKEKCFPMHKLGIVIRGCSEK